MSRHISTLTFEEGAALWAEIMPDYCTPFNGTSYHLKPKDALPERFVFMQGVERMGVYCTGVIWADSDMKTISIDHQKAWQYLNSIGIEHPANATCKTI